MNKDSSAVIAPWTLNEATLPLCGLWSELLCFGGFGGQSLRTFMPVHVSPSLWNRCHAYEARMLQLHFTGQMGVHTNLNFRPPILRPDILTAHKHCLRVGAFLFN